MIFCHIVIYVMHDSTEKFAVCESGFHQWVVFMLTQASRSYSTVDVWILPLMFRKNSVYPWSSTLSSLNLLHKISTNFFCLIEIQHLWVYMKHDLISASKVLMFIYQLATVRTAKLYIASLRQMQVVKILCVSPPYHHSLWREQQWSIENHFIYDKILIRTNHLPECLRTKALKMSQVLCKQRNVSCKKKNLSCIKIV